MGAIIFWAIIRTALVIPAILILQSYIDLKFWWLIGFVSIYGLVIYPAIIQYRNFEEDNKEIINSTLCSSCKNFDKSAVLCMKYDQHPTLQKLPCDGIDWEPVSKPDYEEQEY